MALTKLKSSNIEAGSITEGHLHNTAIIGHTESTAVDLSADYTIIYDASSGSLRKVSLGVIRDFSAIHEHIIPAGNEIYDLGEPENKFRDLYLSSATIHLGNTKISEDDNGLIIKDANDNLKPIRVKQIEIDDTDADSQFKTVMKKVGGSMKFVKVNRNTGEESSEVESQEFSTIKIGSAELSTNDAGQLVIPRSVVLSDESKTSQIPEVNLDIAPEVLDIQVSATEPGDDINWFWTWEQSTLPYARTKITNSPQLTVPLYNKGTYTVNNFAAHELIGNLDQLHPGYFKWIDGAGTDNVISWASNYVKRSVTHPDINDGNATEVQQYTFTVPDAIVVPALNLPQNIGYDVSFSTPGAYTFGAAMTYDSDVSSVREGDNPQIGPLYRGATYTFSLDISLENHPFYITTDNGSSWVQGQYIGEYTDGVTGSRNNGSSGKTTLTFTVPQDAPDTLYYQCANHQSMRGVISIRNLEVETNANGNYVVYFQHTHEGHKTPIELRPIPSLVNQMCLVYDASVGQFVPQDLSTYIENTPSFKEKIKEVAGTATLIAPDGVPVVASVSIFADSSYLPYVGNQAGDIAYTQDDETVYIWDESAYDWKKSKARNTDEVPEGSSSLYYTDDRVQTKLQNVSGNILPDANLTYSLGAPDKRFSEVYLSSNSVYLDEFSLSIDSGKFVVTDPNGVVAPLDLATNTTSDLSEGTNKYYTDARVANYLTTNSYATETYVNNSVNSIIDAAPGALNTLNELAAALGDDPNFATTITNQIASKLNSSHDMTLTLSGDASGSATFTNMGNATLSVTVADDSHNHVISNVDGLQSALDGKLSTTGKAADANKLDGYDWMQSGKDIRGRNIYADDWFRNYNSGEGLYNEATGSHWVSDADGSWTARDSASHMRIRMKTNGTSERGSFYANSSNQVGILDAGGSWAVKHTNDNGTYFYSDGGTEEFKVGRDTVSGNYGTVQTSTTRGGWGGYSIAGRIVFMHNHASEWGIYNDVDNEWMLYGTTNGYVQLRYNNSTKLQTTNTGVDITGSLTVNGEELTGGGTGFTGLRTTSNGRLELYQAADGDTVVAADFGQWFTQTVDFSINSAGHLIISL